MAKARYLEISTCWQCPHLKDMLICEPDKDPVRARVCTNAGEHYEVMAGNLFTEPIPDWCLLPTMSAKAEADRGGMK